MIPILSALTGWLTVQWGVRFFISRVLPRQRAQWTASIARAASTTLFDSDVLEQKVAHPGSFEKLRPQLEIHIDDFMRKGLPQAFPVISTFIGERTIGQLKEIFMKELETIFPQVMKGYIKNLQEDLDPGTMITEKLNAIPTERMQATLYQAAGSQVNKAALLAGLAGLLVGLIQLLIVLLTTGVFAH